MRARTLAATLLVAGVFFMTACALTADLDGLTGGSGDGGIAPGDGTIETSVALPAYAGEAGVDAGPTCAGNHGPAPVALDAGFCIDSTEVTVADYRAFRVAKGGDVTGQPAGCAWNTSWNPTIDTGADVDPVFGANWCQATAYCAWAGKRLCGLAPRGATPAAAQLDSVDDEWFLACSANGTRDYAYGTGYVAGSCNTQLNHGPWAAGSQASCQGGYPGVFDLDGNLWEWEAHCEVPDGGGDQNTSCTIRGGSYAANNTASCHDRTDITRDQGGKSVNDITIRCCSDLR